MCHLHEKLETSLLTINLGIDIYKRNWYLVRLGWQDEPSLSVNMVMFYWVLEICSFLKFYDWSSSVLI